VDKKTRKKTSPIWKMDKIEFQKLIKKCSSYTDVLRVFGFSGAGGSSLTLKQRIIAEHIDCSHILNNNKGRKFIREKIPLEQVMVENSTYSRNHLKKRLINGKILEEKCAICDQFPIHNGKRLVLVLDHINGINNDSRLENLRLLCPNCNSQTETFCGKHNRTKKYYCSLCGKKIKSKESKVCFECSAFSQRKVKDRPSKEQLLREVEETNYCAVARKYGVTDNTIRKWLK
jgi:hypothetical protein